MTRKEQIQDVIKNRKSIEAFKKMKTHFSDGAGSSVINETLSKAISNKALPGDTEDVLHRTLIANTYNYLDSHSDVHLKGIFNKSINETKKIFLLHDHKFETGAEIGNVLKAYEHDGYWNDFGLNKAGSTTALLLDVEIKKAYNSSIFNKYKDGNIQQHSVGMQYVKIALAVDDKEEKEAYKLYNEVLPKLGNPEKAEEQGYFWTVSEAKLRETSAVLLGSNDLTGVFDSNKSLENEDEIQKIFDNLCKNVVEKEKIINICKQFIDTFEDSSRQIDTLDDESALNELKKKELLLKLIKS